MVVAILVFAFTGREPLWWLVLSRIIFIPVIAAVSYEIIRFSGAHQDHPATRLMAGPGLLLQRLTTRQPDDGQIEVAISAMETALAADEGRETAPSQPADTEPGARVSMDTGTPEGGEVAG
jgi:uncharacterized protein YqhQ